MENKYLQFLKVNWKACLAAFIIFVFLIYFFSGSISGLWQERQLENKLAEKDKQIESLKNDNQILNAEKEGFKIQAEGYKNEADKATDDKNALQDKLKQLSADIEPIQKELQDVRTGKRKPSGNLNERILSVESRLNQLYPDK